MTLRKMMLLGLGGAALALGSVGMLKAVAQNDARFAASGETKPAAKAASPKASPELKKVVKTDAEWKKILAPEAYNVLRHEGTEYPFSSALNKEHRKGTFTCGGCNLSLFASKTKFESGTGWPSFWQPIKGHVIETTDADGSRTEVECARCDGHLGHVFNDGPKPTGLRYCMNGVAMKFVPAK
jgi:peptide-methionine (R)-S-oxide reductase